MAFKVTYNYKPHAFEKNGNYIDDDTYTITFDDCKITTNEDDGTFNLTTKIIEVVVTETELDQLYLAIKNAVRERDDVRGYHE